MADELVGPLDEPLHVRRVRVAAIMLTPCQLAVEKPLVHWRHFRRVIVFVDFQSFGAEKFEYAAGINGGHKAALVIEPFRIAFFRNPVADKCQTRRAQAISSFESTGMSPGVLLPNAASEAPYFIKLPAIQ